MYPFPIVFVIEGERPMQFSRNAIDRLDRIPGRRVRMVHCIEEEPAAPRDSTELENWCEAGNSARPIQAHVGDYGIVQRIANEEVLIVLFDDGDERLLYVDEVSLLSDEY